MLIAAFGRMSTMPQPQEARSPTSSGYTVQGVVAMAQTDNRQCASCGIPDMVYGQQNVSHNFEGAALTIPYVTGVGDMFDIWIFLVPRKPPHSAI